MSHCCGGRTQTSLTPLSKRSGCGYRLRGMLPCPPPGSLRTAGVRSLQTFEGSSLSIRFPCMPLPGGTHIWSHLKQPDRSQTLSRHNTAGRHGLGTQYARSYTATARTSYPHQTPGLRAQGQQTGKPAVQAKPAGRSIHNPVETGAIGQDGLQNTVSRPEPTGCRLREP
jgi:hypothetical protein